jgi:hypothetical protein
MLYTIAGVLVAMWLLGLLLSYTAGGLIHLLLLIAVIVIVVNLVGGHATA